MQDARRREPQLKSLPLKGVEPSARRIGRCANKSASRSDHISSKCVPGKFTEKNLAVERFGFTGHLAGEGRSPSGIRGVDHHQPPRVSIREGAEHYPAQALPRPTHPLSLDSPSNPPPTRFC